MFDFDILEGSRVSCEVERVIGGLQNEEPSFLLMCELFQFEFVMCFEVGVCLTVQAHGEVSSVSERCCVPAVRAWGSVQV